MQQGESCCQSPDQVTRRGLISSFALSSTTYSGIIKSNDNSPNSAQITLHSDTDVYGVQFDFGYDSSTLTLNEDGIVNILDICINQEIDTNIKKTSVHDLTI